MTEKALRKHKQRLIIIRSMCWGGMAIATIAMLLALLIWGKASEAGLLGNGIFCISILGILSMVASVYLGFYWEIQEHKENNNGGKNVC